MPWVWLRFVKSRLTYSCLSNRTQRAKINTSYSSWEETLFGVPLGSVFGPNLYIISLCDLLLDSNNIGFVTCADNTPYVIIT